MLAIAALVNDKFNCRGSGCGDSGSESEGNDGGASVFAYMIAVRALDGLGGTGVRLGQPLGKSSSRAENLSR